MNQVNLSNLKETSSKTVCTDYLTDSTKIFKWFPQTHFQVKFTFCLIVNMSNFGGSARAGILEYKVS